MSDSEQTPEIMESITFYDVPTFPGFGEFIGQHVTEFDGHPPKSVSELLRITDDSTAPLHSRCVALGIYLDFLLARNQTQENMQNIRIILEA